MKYGAKHAQPILASIKQLAMTRSSIYEYIDLGVKSEHLIIGHTHRLSSKWGCHFSFKHLDVFISCRVALTHDLE